MSDYSGYSSASRMEIERLQAILVSNGINDGPIQGTSAQAQIQDEAQVQARVQTGAQHRPSTQPSTQTQGLHHNHVSHSQPQPQSIQTNQTNRHGTRKRHSSNQLEGNSKGCRTNNGESINRFNILTHASSYPDQSMKTSSIPSTPGGHRDSYAKKTGLSHKAIIRKTLQMGPKPVLTSRVLLTPTTLRQRLFTRSTMTVPSGKSLLSISSLSMVKSFTGQSPTRRQSTLCSSTVLDLETSATLVGHV